MEAPINYTLLVELIAIVIASSAFLFYFNRLGGWLVAYAIRYLTWRWSKVYITCGSLQVSLLAGRVTFRDLEYHSSNISGRALYGHVTWRYWKFRTKQNEDVDSPNTLRSSLPCRIRIYAEGVEAFIYNTTPAYDEIVRRMEKHEAESTSSGKGSGLSDSWSSTDEHTGIRNRSSIRRDQAKGTSGTSSSDLKSPNSHTPNDTTTPINDRSVPYFSFFHEFCPVEISVRQGSVILGNDATPSVLIAHFATAQGTINHVDSRSPCDDGRSEYKLDFEKVNILTRTNVDYSGPLLAHGKKAYDELLEKRPLTSEEPPSLLSARSGFHRIAKEFAFLRNPKFSTPPVAGLPRDRVWRGLARYRDMDDEAPQHQPRREEREYAKATTLVETPRLELRYYSDDPGPVPSPDGPVIVDPADEIGNIEAAPEYGIDVTIHGGIIKYGPWADRQRDALQTAFAPSIFFDSEPKQRLHPGEQRIHTHMLVNVNLAQETTLRIPTREPSKDWMYDGPNASTEERRYGWLDVTVGPNSSVVYTQSQVATAHGYDTMLALHLDSLSIASSINLHTFVTAKSCKLAITMPTPLRWDAQRDWGFDITLDEPDITLMRDHTTLISDLARDWSSGLQGDFHHFVPNHYNFRVTLLNYGVHLFLNDFNVIDDPRTRADNAMADFSGPRLDAYVAVAATQYRPEFSVVPFSVEAQDIRVEVGVPRWDTHRGVDGSQDIEIGKIGEITATGSYRYYSEPRPDHQETLTLHLEGRRVAFKALGWALRRFFCVKDNYFGGYTSFRTMTEFLERFDHDPRSVGDPVEEKYRPGRSDPYAVQVTMNVEDSLVVMSDQIYGCEKGVVIPVPKLQMSLRSLDHFMDLSLDSPPTFVIPVDDLIGVYTSCTVPPIQDDVIFMEGIELKANRLFGPQPRAETYLCLWEAVVPRITCSLSIPFIVTLQTVLSAVGYNFSDTDNAPAAIYQPAALPDVTFFKLCLGEAVVKISDADSALSVQLAQGINLDLSTWATRSCGSTIGIIIPSASVHVLHRDSVDRRRWNTVAEAETGGSIDIYEAPKGWRNAASKQQAFLRKEDAETCRIAYLYDDGKDPRYGQFSHQVFVPTPRAPDMEPDSDADSNHETTSTSRSSSPESNNSAKVDGIRPRPRRTSTVHRQRDNQDDRSDSGESGSTSSCSSASESDAPVPTDMSTKLADHLRRSRAVRRFMLTSNPLYDEDGPTASEGGLPPAAVRSGTIIKVSLKPVSLSLQPAALRTCAALAVAYQVAPRRPDVLLDKLLIAHTDLLALNDDGESHLALDLKVAHIHARALGADPGTPAPVIDCSVKHFTTRLSKTSSADHRVIDLATWVKKIEVLLCTPKPGMRLQALQVADIPGEAVGRILCEGIEIGLNTRSRRTRSVFRLNMLDTGFVTPAFESIRDLTRIWQDASASLPSPPVGRPVAIVIHDAVRAAHNEDQTLSQPAFAYETSYGLHVDDNRDIRRDLGWTMLTRIRYWMNVLPKPVTKASPDIASYTIAELSKIEDWASGSDDFIRQQAFLKIAFGDDINRDRSGNTPLLDLTFHVFANIDILHLEHQGKMLESEQVASSSLRVVSASTGLQYTSAHKGSRRIKRIRGVNTVKSIELVLQNSIFSAVEPLLSLMPTSRAAEDGTVAEPEEDCQSIVLLDYQVERAELEVLAAGLRLKGVLDRGGVNLSHKSGQGLSDRQVAIVSQTTVTIMVRSIGTELTVTTDWVHSTSSLPAGTVATWESKELGGMVRYTTFQDARDPDQLKLLLSLQHFGLDVRPQMKALHDLIYHVRQEDVPYYKRVFDGFNTQIIRASPPSSPTTSTPVHATVDLSLKSTDLVARAAAGLWVRWELGSTYLTGSGLKDDLEFGIRMDSQLVGAYSSPNKSESRASSRLRLPHVRARGTYVNIDNQGSLSGTLDLGVFNGVMQPATLNRLLDLHRDLGEDIAVLSRQYRDEASLHRVESLDQGAEEAEATTGPLKLDVGISMVGLEIGLRADNVATSIVLEASALSGSISHNGQPDSSLMWQAKAEQLGVSLGHLSSELASDGIETSKRSRSASMELDVDIQDIPATAETPRQLIVRLGRVHSIMHVAALKELVDLLRAWSYDIKTMQEHRAADIAQVKLDGSKFKQKMQSKASKTDKPLSSAWLAERLVTINMTGVGIAIPLDVSTTIDLSTVSQRSGPAMLFSIRTMTFQNKRNQTARFKMQQMELQFVNMFDQGRPEHFVGDYHPSENRMIVPLIDSEAEISSQPGSWKMSAHCSATDFRLSLSPSIADDVFRLIHMYHRGKSHIAQLEKEYRIGLAEFGQPDSTIAQYVDNSSLPSKLAAQQILIKMSFTFNSGIVNLSHRPLDKSHQPDRLVLPSISVWVDYTGAAIGVDDADDGGLLLLNTAIHESRNEIKPSIIPFINDLVRRVRHHPDENANDKSADSEPASTPKAAPADAGVSALDAIAQAPTGRLKVRTTLRIDQSQLKLLCDVGISELSDAFLNLTWSSGGFVASTTLGDYEVTSLAGSITGVTIQLGHQHSAPKKNCLQAGAQDMAFTIAYCPSASRNGQKSLSFVFDTSISSEFRLDAYTAWLCFMAVWADDVWKFGTPAKAVCKEPDDQVAAAPPTQRLAFAIVARFRSIDFDVTLPVTQAQLQIKPLILKAVSDGKQTHTTIRVGTINLHGKGDISGDVTSRNLSMHSTRQSSRTRGNTTPSVLVMSIDAGDLTGNAYLDNTRIVQLHLAPTKVTLADDWSAHKADPNEDVVLAFTIDAGTFIGVVRLVEIPRLLGLFYDIVREVETQETRAKQWSAPFREQRNRKAGQPSAITAALLQTARKASVTGSSAGQVRIKEVLKFKLAGLNLGMFVPDVETSPSKQSLYRFQIGRVAADFARNKNDLAHRLRDIEVVVEFVEWTTLEGHHALEAERAATGLKAMMETVARNKKTERKVFIPHATITMASEQIPSDPVDILEHDCSLFFRDDGTKASDINFSPVFWRSASRAFRQLMHGLDEQQRNRALDRGSFIARTQRVKQEQKTEDDSENPTAMLYKRNKGSIKVPDLEFLGDFTKDLVRWIPNLQSNMNDKSPVVVHRFITVPLEDAMDQLLKLYEKQLPANTDTDRDGASETASETHDKENDASS